MTKKEAQERVKKLREEINYHRYLYHVLDRQEISDAALDSLKKELENLEEKFPELIIPDSPTQRVGGEPLSEFMKVGHRHPMLSLNDAFSIEELEAWEERITRFLGGVRPREYFAELKVDGFAIELVYEKGILEVGSTRGDGLVGEDVTQNLKTIDSIPLKLEIREKILSEDLKIMAGRALSGALVVRGEVFMTITVFKKVNEEQRRKGEDPYANPRNLAAGSIRQLDSRIAQSRDLEFLSYGIATDLGQKDHATEHALLKILGFKIIKDAKICASIEEAEKFWKDVGKKRTRLPYQIDGVVVTVNDNNAFRKLGVVGKAPRGAVALKFPAEQAATVVEGIIIQVGRTGALTPVAVLRPVGVGGTIITRATLHNEDEVARKDVRVGDTVIIHRAGDVIPEVLRVLPKLRPAETKPFRMPRECPICRFPAIRRSGEAAVYCSNHSCFAQEKAGIIHFVSKKGFDIEGLGDKIIDQLINNGLIADAADLFQIKKGDLSGLDRFGEKSAANLFYAINKSKTVTLVKFLAALGIRHVGEELSQNLARFLGQRGKISSPIDIWGKAKKMSEEDWQELPDVGFVVAKSLREWFNDLKNEKFLKSLEKGGVKIISPRPFVGGGEFSGKIFVLTGQLSETTRDEAKNKIRSWGGKVSSSVSRDTDFLVAGKNPGSKYEKAKELGIKIISEKEFLEMGE